MILTSWARIKDRENYRRIWPQILARKSGRQGRGLGNRGKARWAGLVSHDRLFCNSKAGYRAWPHKAVVETRAVATLRHNFQSSGGMARACNINSRPPSITREGGSLLTPKFPPISGDPHGSDTALPHVTSMPRPNSPRRIPGHLRDPTQVALFFPRGPSHSRTRSGACQPVTPHS